MEKPRQDVVRDILHYFLEHPAAIDTVEGIATWRLMEEALKRRVEETRNAIEWLAQEGYLENVTADLFRLNPAQREKAEEFLDTES